MVSKMIVVTGPRKISWIRYNTNSLRAQPNERDEHQASGEIVRKENLKETELEREGRPG